MALITCLAAAAFWLSVALTAKAFDSYQNINRYQKANK